MAEANDELLRALRRALDSALRVSTAARSSVDPETARRISTLVIAINAVLTAMDQAEQPADPDANVTALALARETGMSHRSVVGIIGQDKNIIVQRARPGGPRPESALYHRGRALEKLRAAQEAQEE